MSKVKLASWSTLRKAVTKDPRTYNFDHLLPVERPQHIGKEQGSWAKNIPLPKDRIKQWNIVPGDEIRVLNKWVDSRTVFEVAEINRFRNVLYAPVKQAPEELEDQNKSGKENPKSAKQFNYNECQLYLGNFNFEQGPGLPPVSTPVFATKISTTPVKRVQWGYSWHRHALETVPTIPHLKGKPILIPWPEYRKPATAPPTQETTLAKDVHEVTYKTPFLYLRPDKAMPTPPPEKDMLDKIYNPQHNKTSDDPQPPAEIYLTIDLGNPHSRAKRQRTWQAGLAQNKQMLENFRRKELASLAGRTQKQALADAEWKYREQVARNEKQTKVVRYVRSGAKERLQKKIIRKARKVDQKQRRLTSLNLSPAEHQVIPA